MRISFICFLLLAVFLVSSFVPAVCAAGLYDRNLPVERRLTYTPDGTAFVCVNGTNMFSRAIYAGHDDWRLETSDRPVFATWRKGAQRSIRFFVNTGNAVVWLDSADYCEARYDGGRRCYSLRDRRWKNGELRLCVVGVADTAAAVFRISSIDMPAGATVSAVVCNVKGKRFRRNGDIGTVDNPSENFRPRCGEQPLQTVTHRLRNHTDTYFLVSGETVSADADRLPMLYAMAEYTRRKMAGSVTVTTPDAFLNTLGAALTFAADGAWNGQVWLHGAVGWRVTLPGWRGAYAGDYLGMPGRQRSHFEAYAASQVTGVPVTLPHLMDTANNLARGAYRWGTPVYSNGYICRNPGNNRQFHHYDMNLIFVDELLTHFQFDADTAFMRRMWPLIKSHLEWEKRTFDPDGDHLYDAYCCIWASDALQYESGAVTHSSAYNYRANRLAARVAEIIGEDGEPYRREAESILRAMNGRLWIDDKGHWAEYQDFLGLRRRHDAAALWSVYTPVDCGACSPRQAWRATRYVDRVIPHLYFRAGGKTYETLSTTNWMPYEWSINNVAMAEVLHTALAYWKAGRPAEALRLFKGTVMDFMYCGSSPGNFGQTSSLDVNAGEAYRDFADVTGIASRAVIEGLFGITPEALSGQCIIRPGFPADWDSASIHTPYLDYSFRRNKQGMEEYHVSQHFSKPLKIIIRQNMSGGGWRDTVLGTDSVMNAVLSPAVFKDIAADDSFLSYSDSISSAECLFVKKGFAGTSGTDLGNVRMERCRTVDMRKQFNACVTDIFKNKYLSPRSPYTTLALPVQGIGDWCSTKKTFCVSDSALRRLAAEGPVVISGIPFRSPATGRNTAFVSLWDNYPDSITVPLTGNGRCLYLLMAGSTNAMQSRFENGRLTVRYADGGTVCLPLVNPYNWCPIEQDYDWRSPAFTVHGPRPLRFCLKTGMVSRSPARDRYVDTDEIPAAGPDARENILSIDGGAAVVLRMPIDDCRSLSSITVTATANDVVIGLMAVTVMK